MERLEELQDHSFAVWMQEYAFLGRFIYVSAIQGIPPSRGVTPPVKNLRDAGDCQFNPLVGSLLSMSSGERLIVGRGSGNYFKKLDLKDLEISKSHAEFFMLSGFYWVRDIGSRNGTFLNDKKLMVNRWYMLREGDTLRFASGSSFPLDSIATKHIFHTINIEKIDEIPYVRVYDPPSLENGMLYPGRVPREILAVEDDENTLEFLGGAAEKGVELSSLTELERAKGVCEWVDNHFTTVWDDSETAWEQAVKEHHEKKMSVGYFWAIRSGCCRHKSLALQMAYQELGYESRLVKGFLNERPHAWVEINIDGKCYIADPNAGRRKGYVFLKEERVQKHYKRLPLEILIPTSKKTTPPGMDGTIVYPSYEEIATVVVGRNKK